MIRFLMCFSGLICMFFLIANSWAIEISELEGKKSEVGKMANGENYNSKSNDMKKFFKKIEEGKARDPFKRMK